MLKPILLAILLGNFTIAQAKNINDSSLIQSLFQGLLNNQIVADDFFIAGTFASYRQYANSSNLQPDNNIFFSALIAHTLKDLKPYLTPQETILADTIINRIAVAYPSYKNKKGRLSYNFWPTINGGYFFPNNKILSLLKKKYKLPDDLDDTSIILDNLSVANDSAKQAHSNMQQYANLNKNTIKSTFKKYKKFAAYSTWYGYKMPIDFDFGVHCNILKFVFDNNLPLSPTDSATLLLIKEMIVSNDIFKNPSYISPYYSTTNILLYHVSRLLFNHKIPILDSLKPKIIEALQQQFANATDTLNKTIAATSLLKLNHKTTTLQLDQNVANGHLNNTQFVYYTGYLFAHLSNPIKALANATNATQFKWYCAAFNNCLLLEYLLLKNRKQ
jgi:hypothetical protein